MKLELNQLVIHPEYDDRIGTVIEIDEVRQRARIRWDDKRTWIACKRLRPTK